MHLGNTHLLDVLPLSGPTFCSIKHGRSDNAQAAARKDVERTFGILQAQFAIMRGSAGFWDQRILWYIMTARVIMHKMIIEDEVARI
jgi:hypothetical protein